MNTRLFNPSIQSSWCLHQVASARRISIRVCRVPKFLGFSGQSHILMSSVCSSCPFQVPLQLLESLTLTTLHHTLHYFHFHSINNRSRPLLSAELIRTHTLSRQAAADLRLRTRGHRDRQYETETEPKYHEVEDLPQLHTWSNVRLEIPSLVVFSFCMFSGSCTMAWWWPVHTVETSCQIINISKWVSCVWLKTSIYVHLNVKSKGMLRIEKILKN